MQKKTERKDEAQVAYEAKKRRATAWQAEQDMMDELVLRWADGIGSDN